MNSEALFKTLSTMTQLSGKFKTTLEKELIPLSLPKNYLLLESPHISDFAYFITNGFATSYAYVNGKRKTTEFWKEGQIMLSCNSFFERVPADESIQLMSKSELLCVSYDSVQNLFHDYPEATHLYRAIMNRYYQKNRTRLLDFQQLNARERFEKLFDAYPNIEQVVSQDSIASYLGIAPQSLSRLKRQKGTS